MTIEKKVNGDSAELSLNGWMDTQNAPLLAAAVDELGPGIRSLSLDLSSWSIRPPPGYGSWWPPISG